MKRISFCSFITLFFIQIISAQINTEMKFPTSNEIFDLEVSMMSQLMDSSDLIVYTNPLESEKGKRETFGNIYKRPDSSFPLNLHVWYLFEKDSITASAIIYNWGLYNPSFNANKNTELLFHLNKKETEFVSKFDSIYSQLINKYGEPVRSGANLDKLHILSKKFTWVTDDRYITLNLEFAREINNFPGIGYQTNNFELQISISKKLIL